MEVALLRSRSRKLKYHTVRGWKPDDPVKATDFPESGLFLEDPQISRDGTQLLYARGKITGDIWILKRAK